MISAVSFNICFEWVCLIFLRLAFVCCEIVVHEQSHPEATLDILGPKVRTKNVCVCMFMCVYVYAYVYVYACVCVCLCLCVCVCV